MLNVACDIKNLSEIVILGDFADFYSVSSHSKDPRVFNLLKDEVEDVNDRLDELDMAWPDVKKVYLEGNHEFRLERYLINQAPALFGITSIPHLFGLDKRPKWQFVSYGPRQKHKVLNSYLSARHEPLGTNARLTANRALSSLVYGHIHRIEESHIVGLDEKNHVCFSVGWLGNKDAQCNGAMIFDYVKNHHQWQMGFGIVYVDPSTGYFYHQKVHIMDNYTCVFNGKKYRP